MLVDDNYDYTDEEKRYQYGVFPTAEEAIAACKGIVDSNLNGFMKPGMTASELYDAYTGYGDDPFIVCVNADDEPVVCVNADDESARFSAWEYAEERSRLLIPQRKA